MPITLRSAAMKYKNGSGEYVGINSIADTTTAQHIAALNQAGAAEQAAIVQKGAETLASLPDEYTELSNEVDNLKNAVQAVNNTPTLNWNLGKGIDTSGTVVNNQHTALTDIVLAQGGDRIVYTGAYKDTSNNNFVINIATYKSVASLNDTFVERIAMANPVTLGNDITGYRLHFGRTNASEVTIQESDITTYYSVDIFQKSATEIELKNLETELDSVSSKVEHIIEVNSEWGSVGAMTAIAETYLIQAYSADNQIVYDATCGIYTTPLNQQGIKATVCSQFMKSLLMGTPYAYSRYEQNTNSSSFWGYDYDSSTGATFNSNGQGLLDSDQVAKYCDDKGLLIPYDANHNNIRPGDIIFWSANDNNNYLHIKHSAICLYVHWEGCYIIHAGRNVARPVDNKDAGIEIYRVKWTNYTPSYYARLPLIPGEYANQLLLNDTQEYEGTYSTTSVFIKAHYFNNLPLGIYSMLWEDDGNGLSYIKVNQSSININIDPCKQGNKYYAIFFATEPITELDIRSSQGTTYAIKNFRLYKGYKVQNF